MPELAWLGLVMILQIGAVGPGPQAVQAAVQSGSVTARWFNITIVGRSS